MKQNLFFPILFCAALLFLSGCSTIQGTSQKVKVLASSPTQVFESDEVAKITPAFLTVPRRGSSSFFYKPAGEEKQSFQLEGSYRWRDTFFGNLFLFQFAPIGWIVDYFTGAQWEYPSKIRLPGNYIGQDQLVANEEISVAPPQAGDRSTSTQVATWMELKKPNDLKQLKIKDYFVSLKTFEEFDYDFTQKIDHDIRDKLYSHLNSRYVLESKVADKSDDVLDVDAEIIDVFSDEVIKKFSFKIPKADLDKPKISFLQRAKDLIELVPNTATFDITTQQASIFIDGDPSDPDKARYASDSKKTNTLLSFITSIGFRNFRHSYQTSLFKFSFRIIPSVSLYYDQFEFKSRYGSNEFKDARYDWYALFGGFGPQLNMDTKAGLFYFQIVPGLNLNWVHWNYQNVQRDSVQVPLGFETEFGWGFFVSERFNFRLFIRELSSSKAQWESIVTDTIGRTADVRSPRIVISGFAFGYYFPEARNSLRRKSHQ